MNDTDDTIDGQSGTDTLEQRIAALEEGVAALEERNEELTNENERIKTQLGRGSGLPNVTRRRALAGLVGGALLGATGTASADSGNGKDGPPFADDGHDHSGDSLGEESPVERIDSETVAASRFHSDPLVQDENSGVVDRDVVSAEPLQIWVDPDGDDGADGTEGSPIASLQEALNRLPYILAHPVDIVLTSGTAADPIVHDTGIGVSSGMHMSVYSGYEEGRDYFDGATGMNVAIRSESGNPEDTVLRGEYFLSFSFLGNSPLNVGMSDLTVDAGVQNYGGVFGLVDCVSKGSPALGILFAGYAGTTYVTRGKITAPVVTTDSAGGVTGLNNVTIDPGQRTSSTNEQALLVTPPDPVTIANEDGILKQYQSGATVYIKGGNIGLPYFGEGAIGQIITQENIYHPAAPDGLIRTGEPVEKDTN